MLEDFDGWYSESAEGELQPFGHDEPDELSSWDDDELDSDDASDEELAGENRP